MKVIMTALRYSTLGKCLRSKKLLHTSVLLASDNADQSFSSGYKQGQSPDPKIREYFYFIDHQGMLFLDDTKIKNFTSCFKDKKFLKFFYSQIRPNTTGRYLQFPYYSPCGRERNFVRCDDLPFVYTHVIEKDIFYGHAGDMLKETFQPEMVTMEPSSGRVYHPAPERVSGVGLVKSSLAVEFSNRFRFENGETLPPTHFKWDNKEYILQNWLQGKKK